VTDLAAVVSQLERAGGSLELNCDRIRFRIPDSPDMHALLEILRAEKPAVLEMLRKRRTPKPSERAHPLDSLDSPIVQNILKDAPAFLRRLIYWNQYDHPSVVRESP
jgi:hypothetical protein